MTDKDPLKKASAEKKRLLSCLENQQYVNRLKENFAISFVVGDSLEYNIGDDNHLSRSELHTGFLAAEKYPNIVSEVMIHLPPVDRENDVDSVLDELPDQFSWFDGTRNMSFGVRSLDDHHLPHIAIIDDVDRVDVDDTKAAVQVALNYYGQFCDEENND